MFFKPDIFCILQIITPILIVKSKYNEEYIPFPNISFKYISARWL